PAVCSTLVPYTTLFRSFDRVAGDHAGQRDAAGGIRGAVVGLGVGGGGTGQRLRVDGELARAAERERVAGAAGERAVGDLDRVRADRKSTRLNSSHVKIS